MVDIVIAAIIGVTAGAILGHLLYGRRYKRALRHILAAANDPYNRHLGAALDDADDLLGRQR